MPSRARRLLPPAGRAYELFDCSVLLLLLGMFAYVVSAPPAATTQALAAPLRVVTETQLGLMMTGAALLGIAAAYTRWLRLGYVATIAMTAALAGNFAVGLASGNGELRTVAQVALYGWVCRRLVREYVRP